MKKLFLVSCLAVSLVYFSGCGYLNINVRTYSDPEVAFSKLKKFNTVPINKENPLLEKELLFAVKKEMLKKDYVYEAETPDILIMMDSYQGPYEYYVPRTYITLPEYVPGKSKTFSGKIGDKEYYGREDESGYTEYRTQSYGGYTATKYYRNITLYFVQNKANKNFLEAVKELINKFTEKGPDKENLIWQGTAECYTDMPVDIVDVAPYMIREILTEYPEKSGRPSMRSVSLEK